MFRCENVLITQLEVDNCIRIYQEAEHLQLTRLRDACAEFIAASWNLFEPEHFAEMDAGLLLKLLKSHCKFILHATIQLKRTDVMMLYLVENSESTNEQDENGQFPLDLALNAGRFDCAKILCDHQADINRLDSRGRTFVSKAIEAGNIEACEFLVQNGANISYVNEETGETLIHDLAKSASVQHGIGEWAKRNIRLFDLNARDRKGR
jgi:ankyrin repeat protein